MRTTSAELAAHLIGSGHTMATCWRVERNDGEVFGFTSHDADLDLSAFPSDDQGLADVVYLASTGMNRSAIEGRTGMSVDNAEATGFLNSDAITEDDLRAGVWDHAEIRIFDVNWADLTMGALRQMRGWTGQVSLKDDNYKVELRGLNSALNATIGELVGPSCTAELGDARCKKDTTDYTTTGEVTSVDSNRVFDSDLSGSTVRLTPSTTGAPTTDYFGRLTWLTGANAGLVMEVRNYATSGSVGLQLPMTRDIQPGDTFSIRARCQKSFAICKSQFDNGVNFRGFKDLPGVDKLLRVGGQ